MHLVRQHIIDIQCETVDFGKTVQNQLGILLEKSFYPKLEDLLNKYDAENHVWSLENLEIQLSEISKRNWKEDFINKSLEQVEFFLKSNLPDKTNRSFSDNEHPEKSALHLEIYAEKLFLDFLRKGYMESNLISERLEEIVVKISITENLIDHIISTFKQNFEAILRWIFSVPENFKKEIFNFLEIFTPFTEIFSLINYSNIQNIDFVELKRIFASEKQLNYWTELLTWLHYLQYSNIITKEGAFKFAMYASKKHWKFSEKSLVELLDFIITNSLTSKSTKKNIPIEFYQEWQKYIPESASNKELEITESIISEKKVHLDKEKKYPENASFYIENAGLVILHPFLPRLFEMLELTENNEWKTENSAQKAILVIHFLVFGNEDWEQDFMILNKLICGLPISEAINTAIDLNEEEKNTCNDLLEAVLKHWEIMSSSSRDALRENFLKRKGKLEIHVSEHQLWIEEKGYDILLDKIPWGIGMVKTPWMEHYLTCNWNH